jgi:hypothetical protein
MEVIDLAIVDFAQEAPVDHGFGDHELVGVPQLKTDARFDLGARHRLLDVTQFLE